MSLGDSSLSVKLVVILTNHLGESILVCLPWQNKMLLSGRRLLNCVRVWASELVSELIMQLIYGLVFKSFRWIIVCYVIYSRGTAKLWLCFFFLTFFNFLFLFLLDIFCGKHNHLCLHTFCVCIWACMANIAFLGLSGADSEALARQCIILNKEKKTKPMHSNWLLLVFICDFFLIGDL